MRTFIVIFALIFALLSACAPTPPAPVYDISDSPSYESPEVSPKPLPEYHLVRKGETLVSIGLEYGLTHRELALWNGIANPDIIHVGDKLQLTPSDESPTTQAIIPQSNVATKPTITPVIKPATQSPSTINSQDNIALDSNIPIKTAPNVAKYAYSKQTLIRLRKQHKASRQTATNSAAQSIVRAPSSTTSAAAQTPAVATTPSVTKLSFRNRFQVDWSWPVKGSIIRQYSDVSKGIDIAANRGAPVYAAADGQVVYTGAGVKSYGRLVIIKHKNDYLSAYAHNDSILIKEGDKVARGQQISTVGDSGAAQVMLHLEIRKKGTPFNPLKVLPPAP